MISATNISVRKGHRQILDQVSVKIAPGRLTAVLGMNGAGKTTLLNTINKREKLSDGHITWDGTDLMRINPGALALRRAVLSQDFAPGFPIRVADLVEMGTYPFQRTLSPGEKFDLVEEAIQSVGLSAFHHRDFASLSGGEQKRILLAKCLVQLKNGRVDKNHKYLFLDEPTSSIDIHHSYKILDLVKEWTSTKNIGVLAILHDLNLAAQFADHIIILKDGKAACQGPPEDVFQSEQLEESLEIKSIIQEHPVFECLHITTLPL